MATKLNQIRKGNVVILDGVYHQVVDFHHNTPGNLGAIVQLKLKNMENGNQFTKRFNSSESIETAFLSKRNCQYLYPEGDFFVFMDNESYEQYHLGAEVVGDRMKYVPFNENVVVLYLDEKAVDIELPSSVVLDVTEAEPSIRGNTATNVTKKAVCSTGLEVKVPQHINAGEKISVDTRTGEFLGRAKE